MRRRYTKTEKLAAVAEATINGTEQASDRTGIPESTIRYWLDKPEFAELRAKTREEQRDGYRVLIAKAQEALVNRIADMEPRDLTILLGVAQDKDLLLSGDATARSEHRSLGEGLDDHERSALKRVLVGELARRQDHGGDPGTGLDSAESPDRTADAVEPVAADGGSRLGQD